MSRSLIPPARDYAQGEQFSPKDFNSYEAYSRSYQAWSDREHHPDGWHRAPHIPIAAGVITVVGGVFTLASGEGIASVAGGASDVPAATGLCTITLDFAVDAAVRLTALAWPKWNDTLRAPVIDMDFTRVASPAAEIRIGIVTLAGTLVDEDFVVAIFGERV